MPTVLFVCTGNVCRSPMAAAFARRALAGSLEHVSISSAGILEPGYPPTPAAIKVMARRGLDIAPHRSRRLVDALVPAPDLVVGMAREHARAVVETNVGLFPRTFTLKDLAGRTGRAGPRAAGEELDRYLQRVAARRGLWNLAGSSSADDIADPIGRDIAAYERCADEIERLVSLLIEGIWSRS